MKSSSTGKPNFSLISAIISACFTVSMPSSPSKSWSNSTKSAGYPVCFTTTSITVPTTSEFAGVDVSCVGCTISCSISVSFSNLGDSDIVVFDESFCKF